MILFDFDYERPATLEEAATLLARLGDEARFVAGGTDLLPNIRAELVKPGVLVSLGAIEPVAPRTLEDGTLRIDALERLASLAQSPVIARHAPIICESALAVGSNQIRQMGTLGGNLCQDTRCLQFNQRHDYQFAAPCYKRGGECCYPFPQNSQGTCWSVYMSDVAPALVALDASLEILGEAGARRIGVEELFTGDGMQPFGLGGAALIRAVIVPAARQRSGWGFYKATLRGGLEFGMAVVAVTLQLAADGSTCEDARIVIGAVRERPVRALATERALAGAALDGDRLAKAAAEAAREVSPLPHHGFSKRYLIDAITVHLGRTLARALQRARGRESGIA